MKKRLSLLAFFVLLVIKASAQVTIGSDVAPEKAALLDIKTEDGGAGEVSSKGGGLLLPRVEIANISTLGIFSDVTGIDSPEEKLKHKGLTVYNIGMANVEAGIYTWDGSKWRKAGSRKEVNFFYMPSIKIDLSVAPAPIDLYMKYRNQFLAPKVVSTGAPAIIPYYTSPADLYYYVTDYDEDVFASITISETGVMTYTLQSVLPPDANASFINIVFVIR